MLTLGVVRVTSGNVADGGTGNVNREATIDAILASRRMERK
jgi:hypothetical protein